MKDSNFYLNRSKNALPLYDEEEYKDVLHQDPKFIRRREVLKETVEHIKANYEALQIQAQQNLKRWHKTAAEKHKGKSPQKLVQVYRGDWGVITHQLTKEWGQCFAALNMANAEVPGGGYLEGMIAQEENMYRRTDCHFSITIDQLDSNAYYKPELTDLLNAKHNLVYLDAEFPRICIRGPEDSGKEDLGYAWLTPEEIFPFYELRAAAVDLRYGQPFDPEECLRRIRTQFNTLKLTKIRHVVLGAHGCGAFRNPGEEVAKLYAQAIEENEEYFDCIAFAIFHAGYGPGNYEPFSKQFE